MVGELRDELTLICGGGYIKITGGNVEIGGSGKGYSSWQEPVWGGAGSMRWEE
ncbi:hypothetical protein KAM622c_28970 [Klebsiella quasipneumoniae subsp. quasipneumoniae]|nr:hypothetical protein KAM622c_28970 [Klebsiella quasipneumoniae subsp. quasipneumoniae]